MSPPVEDFLSLDIFTKLLSKIIKGPVSMEHDTYFYIFISDSMTHID